jgi:hypothetical protein
LVLDKTHEGFIKNPVNPVNPVKKKKTCFLDWIYRINWIISIQIPIGFG